MALVHAPQREAAGPDMGEHGLKNCTVRLLAEARAALAAGDRRGQQAHSGEFGDILGRKAAVVVVTPRPTRGAGRDRAGRRNRIAPHAPGDIVESEVHACSGHDEPSPSSRSDLRDEALDPLSFATSCSEGREPSFDAMF
ncbi:hypothetical protein JHFBIEKO_2578 [Methylobacterium mesophilicum]|nr:hypothetical protein JHFBIEKO_2578 [Methylobacterium mesophilicum]